MNILMVFDFTQFWLDGRPGNEHFWISHKISDLMTPLPPVVCIRSVCWKWNLKQIEAIFPSVMLFPLLASVVHQILLAFSVLLLHCTNFDCGHIIVICKYVCSYWDLFGKLSKVHFLLLVICLLPVSSPLWTFMIIIIDKEMDHSAILLCLGWTRS